MTDNDPGAPDERAAREIRGYLAALADLFGNPAALGAEPLALARAAALVRHVATGYAHTAGVQARGAGATWDEVADALGVDIEPLLSARVRVAMAFDQLAGHALYPHPPTVRWTCSTCAGAVTDYGPETPAAVREHGHAVDCRRHAAELAGQHNAHPTGNPTGNQAARFSLRCNDGATDAVLGDDTSGREDQR